MSFDTERLKDLPMDPGVYLYKNKSGKIIYVGKAARLRNRVRQYFQKGRAPDPKTEALVAEIADLDWITVDTELDALFLEAELIRRYKPRYNILLRDDKSSGFIRIDYNSDHPTVTVTRRPLDDGAKYFGPYYSVANVRKALQYLRRAFPFSTHVGTTPRRACLQYHLGLCPGLEENKTSLQDYRANLRKLMQYFKGERKILIKQVERDMLEAAKKSQFEEAGKLKRQLFALKGLTQQIVFSDKEFMDLSKDEGLAGLAALLGLPEPPRRIEGYDISHMSGTDTTASMVVFANGLPNKAEYRKFKMRIPGNDDFAHMNEAITRRLSEKNVKQWGLPNLFLIDGGKGQLSAAIAARNAANMQHIPMIGLAKREEEIVIHNTESLAEYSGLDAQGGQSSGDFTMVLLPKSSHVVKLLQRIRDESHRFAVSYHTVLKRQRQTSSFLDDIPTIGPVTRKKLLRTFGSVKRLMEARQWEIEKVVGTQKAAILRQYIRAQKKSQ
jgi:excinuclease ABC subunit C